MMITQKATVVTVKVDVDAVSFVTALNRTLVISVSALKITLATKSD